MDTVRVVVGHVLLQQAPEVTFPENDHMIEKLSPAASHPAPRERVLPGAPVRRTQRGSMPNLWIAVVTSAENIESWSYTRKRRVGSSGKAPRSGWITHAAAGAS